MMTVDFADQGVSPDITKYYADQVGSGKMDYDIAKKRLVKPEGFFDSVFRGMENHSENQDLFDFISTHNKDEIINELEKKRKDYSPTTPVYKSKNNFASVGSMLGENMAPLAKMEGPGLILGAAAAPELAGSLAGLGVLFGSKDFHDTRYANTFNEAYQSARNEGDEPDIAYQKAEKEAEFAGNVAFAQGIAMGSLKLGKEAEFKPVTYGKPFLNVLTDIGNNSKELVKSLAPDVAGQSAIAGGIKAIENAHAGRPITENTGEAMVGTALFMAGLGALRAKDVFLNGNARNTLVDGYAKAPESSVDAGLATLVHNGNLEPNEALNIKTEINTRKNVKGEEMPEPSEPTPTFKTEKEQLDDLTKNLTGQNKVMYDKDPEGFLKYIADQVHGGRLTDVEAMDGVTSSLVNKALEKYPEHQSVSNVSVIKPSENIPRETVEIKPKGQIADQEAESIFNDLTNAELKSGKFKNRAKTHVEDDYGEIGSQARFIHDNYDEITKQLIDKNIIKKVPCP